jgi:hypothetical protein
MDYVKPEIIDIDSRMAGGVPCNYGYRNFSTGCTTGLGNEVNCNEGNAYGGGAGCAPFGLNARPPCGLGWFVG